MYHFKTFDYMPAFVGASKNWALEGTNLQYGDEPLKPISEASCAAIIDTGSSTIGVPAKLHDKLRTNWEKVTKLDCVSNDDFCETKDSCDSLLKKLKPIGFVVSGVVLEIGPDIYLNQIEGKCQFGIYRYDLGEQSMFLIGEPILTHLYSVYDL